jgi:hypothetical protein
VDWWFAYKFDAEKFASDWHDRPPKCAFAGTLQKNPFSQAYAMAAAGQEALADGPGLIGTSDGDPLGATFGEIYNGKFHYILWNDQFDPSPAIHGGATWAHAKGMVAWDDAGDGMVVQVTTPSWPGSASPKHPRTAMVGNTLGCIQKPNNVIYAQHFFALRLTHDDLLAVLDALKTASVVTDTSVTHSAPTNEDVPNFPELFNNGGPDDVQKAARLVGVARSLTKTPTLVKLSSGVRLIAKPSAVYAPPWQLVSSMLDNEPLRVASWWGDSPIPDTTAGQVFGCWPKDRAAPGAVSIVHAGYWDKVTFNLEEGPFGKPQANDGNHAKIGISGPTGHKLVVFGDMNQAGFLEPTGAQGCAHSQVSRGGLFFVLQSDKLWASLDQMFQHGPKGSIDPENAPKP